MMPQTKRRNKMTKFTVNNFGASGDMTWDDVVAEFETREEAEKFCNEKNASFKCGPNSHRVVKGQKKNQ